ncbi:MAG: hypothetical protein ACTS3F_07770 [Phycisphaerales bacterium]
MITRVPVKIPAALLALAALAAPATAQVEFEAIPGTISCLAMSSDARFIVGDLDLNGDPFADGLYLLDTLTGDMTVLDPEGLGVAAVSDDGTIVLGDMGGPDPNDPLIGETAAIWTLADGWTSLGALPNAGNCPSRSNGYSMTTDGSVVVGLSWDGCSGRGFKWTPEGGMVSLQNMSNGGNRASIISPDGAIIAGFAQGTFNRTPTKWDGQTLMGTLLGPGGADAEGEVRGISDDGQHLIGTVYLGGADGAFDAAIWSSGGPAQPIGSGSLLPGWGGNAEDIAANGTVIGFDTLLGNRRAWIRPAGSNHLQLLKDWAIANGASIPSNVQLWVPRAITNDGSTIIGFGFDGTKLFGFRITIPIAIDCPGDANSDGAIDSDDLGILLANFGTPGPEGDFDGNGTVDSDDLGVLLGAFGTTCD